MLNEFAETLPVVAAAANVIVETVDPFFFTSVVTVSSAAVPKIGVTEVTVRSNGAYHLAVPVVTLRSSC